MQENQKFEGSLDYIKLSHTHKNLFYLGMTVVAQACDCQQSRLRQVVGGGKKQLGLVPSIGR